MTDDDIGTVRWFGQSWDAPVNDPRTQIAVPFGKECIYCYKPIREDDTGISVPGPPLGRVYFHKNCFFDEVGVPHE